MKIAATPSIEHLLVLLAVVETGSFTAAAERLGRATSAVSYSIDALEELLGVSLFDRGMARRPKLTPEGQALVFEAKAVARSVERFRARAKGLRSGLESEISLVVDSIFPKERLVAVLVDFRRMFPTVPIRLLVRTLSGVQQAIRNGDADIGVGGLLHVDSTGLRRIDMGTNRMVPVAAPHHPLVLHGDPSPLRARDHLQLVLSDQRAGHGRDYGVVGQATWRVGDVELKHRLLLAGIGWGGMPELMVRADIQSGRLVQLDVPEYRTGDSPLVVIFKSETQPGPAGQWLIERLLTSFPAIEAEESYRKPKAQKKGKIRHRQNGQILRRPARPR
ncbi:MAG TPA: LysR family transcriptional regulator [Xanthobacteraceae bacterium]|jgi:DNA-binding transcriptional LysR family regulator